MIPEDKYYINIGKAPDLKDKKERMIYRLLEMIPGFLVWTTLLLMVFLSWQKPVWAAFFIIMFCCYWLLRTIHFIVHLTAAYKKMKINLEIDWLKKLDEVAPNRNLPAKNWKEIYHLVVLPMYKEGYEIIKGTMDALVSSDYPKDKIIIALGIEERAGESAQSLAEKALKDYGDKFYKFLITRHPKDIVGEIAGKGSNESWVGKKVKEEIVDVEKIPYENIIVSCFDIDTQVYPKYLSCLTFYYLTAVNPLRSSYQPIPLYLNNQWEAPLFSRLVSSCNVFWQMMQQQRPEKLVTYSSHAMPFKALVDMDFWQKNVVSEDAGIFWKSFLFYDGDYEVVPIYYPISMDACLSDNWWKTAIGQYKQQRRWAWGSEGIPYLVFGLIKNKKISFKKKMTYPILMIEGFWAWGTNAVLILCLGWLPLFLGGHDFNNTVLAYNLPVITRNLMSLAMVGLLACIILNTILVPRPKGLSFWKKFSLVYQWIFFPVGMIFFGALPSIEAQTRLMLGKYMGFWVTEKARKNRQV